MSEKTKALVAVKPFIVPGIGRIERSFGPFTVTKDFPFVNAIAFAKEQGTVETVEVEASEIRTLEIGMPLVPSKAPEAPVTPAAAPKIEVK